MDTEIWKPIDSAPGYLVSNCGRCKNEITGHIIKPELLKTGYMYVRFGKISKTKRTVVHRLVLLAFCGRPTEGCVCHHRDGNKQNNNLQNLEWVTSLENTRHALITGLRKPKAGSDHWLYGKTTPEDTKKKISLALMGRNTGQKNGRSRLHNGEVWLILKLAKQGISHTFIAKMFLVSRPLISMIVEGKRWNSADV